MKIDIPKSKEVVNEFLHKTSEAGKKAAIAVQDSAITLAEKAKQDGYLRKMKKYNPLFPHEYNDPSFCRPNMIVIVDDAVRRGIDVCEGAIGWRSMQNGVEVLHLYDEAVAMSGVQFVPSVICDAIYYVDSFDRNRYIRTDCIFSKAHEERLAELKNVAYLLGAKSCSIEIVEATQQSNISHKKIALSESGRIKSIAVKSEEKSEQELSFFNANQRSGKITVEFEGVAVPKRPKLKWFAHDENIKKLIDMRCKGENTVKTETLELAGASSSTMSQKTACAIDGAIGKICSMKGSSSMESQAVLENSSKLIFCVKF